MQPVRRAVWLANITGKVQYVGIANNLARRAAEHVYESGIQIYVQYLGRHPEYGDAIAVRPSVSLASVVWFRPSSCQVTLLSVL
jgi:hypothetical protein